MFRPDRIGTPVIHTEDALVSTAAYTVQQYAWATQTTYPWQVINATAVADFGRSAISWTGVPTAAIAAEAKWSIGQQFTITQPLNGDVRGVELNGAVSLLAPASMEAIPFVTRLQSAPSAVFQGGATQDIPTYLNAVQPPGNAAVHTVRPRLFAYKQKVIFKGTTAWLPGTFFHGFQFITTTGGGFSLTHLNAAFSVRQLNDQQNVSYADTLR